MDLLGGWILIELKLHASPPHEVLLKGERLSRPPWKKFSEVDSSSNATEKEHPIPIVSRGDWEWGVVKPVEGTATVVGKD